MHYSIGHAPDRSRAPRHARPLARTSHLSLSLSSLVFLFLHAAGALYLSCHARSICQGNCIVHHHAFVSTPFRQITTHLVSSEFSSAIPYILVDRGSRVRTCRRQPHCDFVGGVPFSLRFERRPVDSCRVVCDGPSVIRVCAVVWFGDASFDGDTREKETIGMASQSHSRDGVLDGRQCHCARCVK